MKEIRLICFRWYSFTLKCTSFNNVFKNVFISYLAIRVLRPFECVCPMLWVRSANFSPLRASNTITNVTPFSVHPIVRRMHLSIDTIFLMYSVKYGWPCEHALSFDVIFVKYVISLLTRIVWPLYWMWTEKKVSRKCVHCR